MYHFPYLIIVKQKCAPFFKSSMLGYENGGKDNGKKIYLFKTREIQNNNNKSKLITHDIII